MVHHVHQCSNRHWIRRGSPCAHDYRSHHYRKPPWHSLAHLSWTRRHSALEPFVATYQASGAGGVQAGVYAELPHAMVASYQVGCGLSDRLKAFLTPFTGSTGSAFWSSLSSGSSTIFLLIHLASTPLNG